MRRHKILARTLLMLSILNFALAVPVAVRLDANATRNVTTASQKRRGEDGSEELPLTNMPGSQYIPPSSPHLTDTSPQMAGQLAEQHMSTEGQPPDGLGSPTGPRLPVAGPLSHPPERLLPNVPGSDYALRQSTVIAEVLSQFAERFGGQYRPTGRPQPPPDNLALTGKRLPLGLKPVASSLYLPPPPEPHPSQPGPSVAHPFQLRPGFRLSGYKPPPPPPQSQVNQAKYLRLKSKHFANKLWDKVLEEAPYLGFMLNLRPLPPPPPFPHSSQPGPSEHRFPSPSGISANPERLSPTGSTGTQPTLPGVDTETHSSSIPNSEPSATEILDKALKGKFKRRTSSSDAASLTQRETRSRIFYP
jgi:hypothetical protein